MSVRWPRFLTPSELSQILKKQKHPLTALKLFNEAQIMYPKYRHNGPVYAAMIRILGGSGRVNEMKKVIDQMRNDACECRDYVFVDAIKTYCDAGFPEEAYSLFKNIPEFNCVNWTESFHTILKMLIDDHRFDDARRLFLENYSRWEVSSRVLSLNILMAALCEKGRSDIAQQIFVEMKYQTVYPDRESYRILMKGLCRDGRLSEAVHLLYAMFWRISQKGGGDDVAIYRNLLDTLCDHGKVEEAVAILGKILRKGLRAPRRKWFRLDLDKLGGDQDKESLKRMMNRALIQGGVPSLASYTVIATELYGEDNVSEGDEVLEEMRGRGFRPTALLFEAKMSALCRKGETEKAVGVIETEMVRDNCLPNVKLYNVLLKHLCEGGGSRSAVGYLKEMAKISGCAANEESYSTVVNGLCREGEFVEASVVMEKMLAKRCWPCSDEPFNGLIKGFCSVGKPYEAVMWLEEMISQGKLPERSVWNALVSSVCCNNMADFKEFY